MYRTVLVAACLCAAGCMPTITGSGHVVTKAVDVPGPFHAVRGAGAIGLTVRHGDAAAISVETDDNLVGLLHVEAKDGTLALWTGQRWESKSGFRVTVTAPALDAVSVDGAVTASVDRVAAKDGTASVRADGASDVNVAEVSAKSLHLEVAGASDVEVAKASVASLDVEASGASGAVVRGDCGVVKLRATGASHIGDSSLRARTADVVASGASHVDLDVAESLRADASGASTIRYGGSPKVEASESGASTVGKR